MSSGTVGAVSLSLVAGLAGAVQVAVQGPLQGRVGSIGALATASVIGGVVALAVLLVAERSVRPLVDAAGAPPWQLLGGLMSVVIIIAITIAGPRIGIVATTGILVASQFALGAAIDRFGWLGVERIPLSPTRVTGLVLLGIGAALTLRR